METQNHLGNYYESCIRTKGNSIWDDMVKSWINLHQIRVIPFSTISRKLEGIPHIERHSTLYQIKVHKNCSVADRKLDITGLYDYICTYVI
uniref:Uncharacterized protein n=1 Tax=Lactuca sativa TaxID=4236 RepID=A0A9R1UIC1_LACSA|nr:hypothetical protein LSAT_V11C900506260 [Lactuca sativa]